MLAVRVVVASAALVVSTTGISAGIGTAVAATPDAGPGDVTVTTTPDGVDYEDASLADENTTTVEGTLRITSIDRVRGGEYAYAIETSAGEVVPLAVQTPLPLAAANGAIEAEVVDPGPAESPLAAATVQAPGQDDPVGVRHRAYVVLVAKTGPLPSAVEVSARLDGSVLDEWSDEAGRSIDGFSVAGTATLSATAPTRVSKTGLCAMTSPYALWDAGRAKFPGVDFSPGSPNHLVMVVSGSRSGCGTSTSRPLGVGTVGASIDDGGLSTLLWDPAYVDATGVHELGHNFGLGHANVKACETCAVSTYLDVFSVMGFGIAGAAAPALDSEFRDQLALTRPGETEVVALRPGAATVTRRLAPRGSSGGLRGLQVVDPATDQTYWVELRAGGTTDRDAGSAYARPQGMTVGGYRFAPGVTITQRGDDADLDLLPHAGGSSGRVAWDAGDTMTSDSGAMSVTVDDVTSTSATVTVVLRAGTAAIATEGAPARARVGAAAQAVTAGWDDGTELTYRWTVDGSLVSSASSYVPTPSQRGDKLGLTVRGTAPGGVDVGARKARPISVGYGVFTTSTPTISGTIKAGRTLTGSAGVWSPAPTSYRWQYYSKGSWRDLPGAIRTSYKISLKYRGKKLRFRVKGSRSGYTVIYQYSSATTTVKS